jgi:hypothetical protein
MIITGKAKLPRKGFLLMEALLAFSIFGIAVTSIVIALHHTSKVSYEINREAWAQSQLKNILTEVLTIRTPEEEFPRDAIRDLPNAKARILITPITEPTYSEDSTAQILKKMYQVSVTLYWDEDGTERSKSAITTHYYPLHQRR